MNAFQQIINFLKPELDEKPALKKVVASYPGQSGGKFKDGLDAALLEEATEHAEKVHGHLTSAQLKKHGLQVSIELPNGALKSDLKAKQDLQTGKSEKDSLLTKLKIADAKEESASTERKEGKESAESSLSGEKDLKNTPKASSKEQAESSNKLSKDAKLTTADLATSEKVNAESNAKESDSKDIAQQDVTKNSAKKLAIANNKEADSKSISSRIPTEESPKQSNNPTSESSNTEKTTLKSGINESVSKDGSRQVLTDKSDKKSVLANQSTVSSKEADAKTLVAKENDDQKISDEKSSAKKVDVLKTQVVDKKQSDTVEKTKTVNSEVLKEAKKLKNQSDSVEISDAKEKAESSKESLHERFAKASTTNSEVRNSRQTPSNAPNAQAITGAGIEREFSDQEVEENPKTNLSASELRKLDSSEENNEAKLLNNSGFMNLRREISGRIAGIIQRQAQSSNSSGSWQHHRFSLDGGKSLNVSMKQSEGKIQLMLGTGNSEIQKLLQQHIQEIRTHLQEQFEIEIELELRQDAENGQNQGFAENLKKNELNNTDKVSTEQETSNSSETDNSVRSFGFNKNEWTG